MESRYSHHIHNWLSYAQSQRLQVIGGAFVAAVVGLSAAAFVFRKGAVSYSRTAEVACTLRLISQSETEPRYRTRDFLASYFLPWQDRLIARLFPWYVKRQMEQKFPAGLSWVIARTHIYDHVIESTLAEDRQITQIVILGAGFDTRFYRLRLPNDRVLKCIEVDEGGTQRRKREIIASIPTSAYLQGRYQPPVTYVPVNFEVDSIESALTRHRAYDPSAKTIFLWEAVTGYLNEAAVNEVLDFVKRRSGPGSILAFDVRFKEAMTGEKRYNSSKLTSTVAKLKESYHFGVPEGKSREWIESHGFLVEAIYGPEELAELVTSDVSYSLLKPDIMDIIVARTPN